jgi:hypothetical protein
VPASLALRHGVVWTCRSEGVARLAPHDLGGRRIGPGFSISAVPGRRLDVRGIAIDEDRRIWAADAGSGSVRAFTAFGAECGGIAARDGPDRPRKGRHPARPAAFDEAAGIAAQGVESDLRLLVSRRGEDRHALLLVDPRSGSWRSFRSGGDPSETFSSPAGVALAGRMAFVCEAGRGRIQAFRDGEFHYPITWPIAWRPGGDAQARFEPQSVAATPDGRTVVAGRVAGEGVVLHFDAGGSFVRRIDGDLASGEDAVDEDVCGVVVEEGGSERQSTVLVLDRGGSRVLAFTLDGACQGAFHDLDTAIFRGPEVERGAQPRAEARSSPRPRRS